MSESLAIEFARVEGLSSELAAATSAITAILEQLDETSSSLRAQWGGAAQEAYVNAHAQWNQRITAMTQVLSNAHSTTASVAERHRKAENAVAALWGQS